MLDIDAKAERLEDDKTFCSLAEILRILTKAERRGQNLYKPLKQIEDILHYLDDENLLTLYQRLLHGFRVKTTHKQAWSDDYFSFILLLCNLLNDTIMKFHQDVPTGNASRSLISA